MSLESIDGLDHVIFVYRSRGRWGSVARSRDPGLHGRRPVFRTLRQLALTYFDALHRQDRMPEGVRRGGSAGAGSRTTGDCRTGNVWKVERLLFDIPHRPIRVVAGAGDAIAPQVLRRSSRLIPAASRPTTTSAPGRRCQAFRFLRHGQATAGSVEVEVPLRLRDRLFLGLPSASSKRFDSASPRVFSDCTDCSKMRVATRLLVRQNLVRIVQLRLVGALGLHVTDDALESLVDHERGLAAGTRDFVFGSQCRHKVFRDSSHYHSHMSRDWVDVRVATYNIHRARGLDRRTRPDRIASVLAATEADVVALQEVIGPGLGGPGHAETIGAALGMGWVMAPTKRAPAPPVRKRDPQPLPDPGSQSVRPDVEDLRAAELAARGDRPRRRPAAAVLQRALRHGAARAAAIRRPDSRRGFTTGARPARRSCVGDFNEWGRGLVADLLAARLSSVDLFPLLQAAPDVSRLFSRAAPRPHLLRRRHRGAARASAADADGADRLRPSAAGGRHQSALRIRGHGGDGEPGASRLRVLCPSPRPRRGGGCRATAPS